MSHPRSGRASTATRMMRLAYLRARREFAQRTPAQTVNLALQGGGALGAFTAGALIRLSKERGLRIGAMSGASAGALNAAVFTTGFAAGGRRGAEHALSAFWDDVSAASDTASLLMAPALIGVQNNMWTRSLGEGVRQSAAAFGRNPLRAIVENHVDTDALKQADAPRLFISATNIRTASARIFRNEEITTDALLASACLPMLHGAIEIDGERYWDGGFTSNPPIEPLLGDGGASVVLVRLIRAGAVNAPRSASDIDSYLARLAFARPTEEELTRIARRGEGRVEEIDLSGDPSAPKMSARPGRRLVSDLMRRGVEAAESFLAAKHARYTDGARIAG